MGFKLPESTEWMREQMNHEPTREYAESLHALVKKYPFKKGLEIGCMWGVSTLSFLLGSNGHLTSVDKSDYTHAKEEVGVNGLDNRWEFIVMDSKDYWEYAKEKDVKFDFIYVDGNHGYDYAHLDIQNAWLRLKSGGILAIDDALHKNNKPGSVDPYGVSIASLEHLYNNPTAKIGFEGRILWFKK